MRAERPANPAFSLVELVIVIAIMGVLAAIAAPRFLQSAENAELFRLKTDLLTVRNAMRLYAAEHGDRLPNIKENGDPDGNDDHFIERLVGKTDRLGDRIATGEFGPYLREWPRNRFIEKADDQLKLRIDGAAAGDDKDGWHFDSSTGRFSADSAGHQGL